MASKRATFTLTTVAGVATGSAHLQTPSSPTRPVYLDAVSIDGSAAFGTPFKFELYEAFPDSSNVVTEGRQLLDIDDKTGTIPVAEFDAEGVAQGPTIRPRTSAGVVDETGAAVSGNYNRIDIRQEYLIATIRGGNEGDVWTVYVTYETAGDWRF